MMTAEKTASLEASIVRLSNGKKVANFSSPHDFNFEDGSVAFPENRTV